MGTPLRLLLPTDRPAPRAGAPGPCPAPGPAPFPGAPDPAARPLVLRLARELHASGVAAPQLEEAIGVLGRSLGEDPVALASPTSLFLAFRGEDGSALCMERLEPAEIDLGRLVALEALARTVESGAVGPAEALARLDARARTRPEHGAARRALAHSVAAAGAAVFFGARVPDVLAAGVLGLLVGVLALRSIARPALARLLEPAAALGSTLGASALAARGLVSDADAVALAALIVLVPGYTTTVALSELARRHLTAGTTRLFGALGTFLGLGLGVALGHALAARLLGPLPAPVAARALPAWALPLALATMPLAFGVLFQVRARALPWVLAGGLVAWSGLRCGTAWLGPELGAGFGALAVGVAANAFARVARLPASLMLVPGVLLLVPGSIGFRSVAEFLRHDPVAGLESGFRMALVATSLVGGLLAAHALVPPRRIL